ncbi:hypothetical protein TRFO_39149 [Tritrichomonas foetus]|uniref:Myb-like domain-containing protein n=1 Tax=Tritrichomonas foetus TaxID=1144522 RepID=A0A1J4J8V6_9EUKA|nr:hypothetical protein TRFO_39149 [Tritrichomonas foetus]|eukprot:OHS94679.1 hypothetical protein TRFO_39149 [Tritrichomonas foetus]
MSDKINYHLHFFFGMATLEGKIVLPPIGNILSGMPTLTLNLEQIQEIPSQEWSNFRSASQNLQTKTQLLNNNYNALNEYYILLGQQQQRYNLQSSPEISRLGAFAETVFSGDVSHNATNHSNFVGYGIQANFMNNLNYFQNKRSNQPHEPTNIVNSLQNLQNIQKLNTFNNGINNLLNCSQQSLTKGPPVTMTIIDTEESDKSSPYLLQDDLLILKAIQAFFGSSYSGKVPWSFWNAFRASTGVNRSNSSLYHHWNGAMKKKYNSFLSRGKLAECISWLEKAVDTPINTLLPVSSPVDTNNNISNCPSGVVPGSPSSEGQQIDIHACESGQPLCHNYSEPSI